jgi:hypothetical protein
MSIQENCKWMRLKCPFAIFLNGHFLEWMRLKCPFKKIANGHFNLIHNSTTVLVHCSGSVVHGDRAKFITYIWLLINLDLGVIFVLVKLVKC